MTLRRPALFAAFTLSLSLACAAPRPAAASEAGARAGGYTLTLVDEGGRQLPTFQHQGRTYVLGKRGERYLLRVRNETGRRVEVVASVDGRDVIDGRPAALARRGYLVAPWGELAIDGFRVSGSTVAAFRFGTVEGSYAARMGDARDVGVIGVAVFPEAAPRPPPVDDWSARGGGAAESEAQRSAPSASSADGLASGPAAREERRKGLGTGFGEEHPSQVEEVPFERASTRPAAVLALRYDDRAGLLALGIDVDGPRVSARDRWMRDTAEPFRRDGRFAEPPPGWPGR
jgi:hypothetical protein